MEASTQTTEIASDTAQRATTRPQTAKPLRKPRAKKAVAAPSEPAQETVQEPVRETADETSSEVVQLNETTDEVVQPDGTTAKSVQTSETADEVVQLNETTDESVQPDETTAAAIHEPVQQNTQETGEQPGEDVRDETHERAIASIRAHETPIFAAMFAHWDGPAAGLIGRTLHRADADTMIFDAVMWRPGPDAKAPALRFQVGGDRHAPVITATGELTAGSVSLLTTPLRHILRRRPRQLIVDLAGIASATPAGLRTLLDVRQAARAGHVDFWLRSPSEPVRALLQPAGTQVAVRPNGQAARKSFSSSRKGGKVGAAMQTGPAASADADLDADLGANVDADVGAGYDDYLSPGTDTTKTPETTARFRMHSRTQAIAAKLPGVHRREAGESRVLEGIVVEGGPASRTHPWWSSHALRESLRRVGAHQSPHGHGSPT